MIEYSYYAVFEFSTNDEIEKGFSAIGIYFPDVPGCISCGDDMQHGLEMAKESLSLHIEGLLEDGDDLPIPSEEANLLKKLLPHEKLFEITIVL